MDDGGVGNALVRVRELYTESLHDHGNDSRSVGWKTRESQLLRFEKLAVALDGIDGPLTVNDWGCGYGAMFGFLAERLGDRLAAYAGYDISDDMIAAAREAVTDPRATFHLGDEPAEADVTFVSGTFNVRFDADADAWREWIESRLRQLTAVSRRALAFNLLSTYVDWQEPHLYYGDPRAFFDFCKRHLSPRVALLHDYELYEWTIVVRR